jgi:hypothetical protein
MTYNYHTLIFLNILDMYYIPGALRGAHPNEQRARGNPLPSCTKPRTRVTNMSENYFQ